MFEEIVSCRFGVKEMQDASNCKQREFIQLFVGRRFNFAVSVDNDVSSTEFVGRVCATLSEVRVFIKVDLTVVLILE